MEEKKKKYTKKEMDKIVEEYLKERISLKVDIVHNRVWFYMVLIGTAGAIIGFWSGFAFAV